MADKKEKEKIRGLIGAGSEITGGAVGGALGFLAGGPIGAAALGAGGVLASKMLNYVGSELSERLLGPREKVRIGATLALAAEEISQRIKKGELIRNDGFFDEDQSGRSNAEELAESVLLKSQREAEEKKIPLLAHLLANISFSPEINVALGHQMIKATDSLTYRQLCILRLVAMKENFPLRKSDYRGEKSFSRDLYQILHECYDLYNREFINNGGSVALGMTDLNPSDMTIQGLGVDLHNWMQLWQIPIEHITPIAEVLSKQPDQPNQNENTDNK
jgi:hypothetical protein